MSAYPAWVDSSHKRDVRSLVTRLNVPDPTPMPFKGAAWTTHRLKPGAGRKFYGARSSIIATTFQLVCFSDTIKGPLRQMFFVVLPLDGTVVEPERLERTYFTILLRISRFTISIVF
jgi:hypothetical protein